MSAPHDAPDTAREEESSRFGKLLGIVVCAVLLVIAALVAVSVFGGGSDPDAEVPVETTENPFK